MIFFVIANNKQADRGGQDFKAFRRSFTTMASMIYQQASFHPSGNHGFFNKFNIESVTIIGKATTKSSSAGMMRVGR